MQTENFFKNRMSELGITHFKLALALGVHPGTVSGWTRGVNTPPIAKSDLMAELLKVTPARMREEIAILAKRIADKRDAVASR